MMEDKALVKQILAGNTHAFGLLVSQYQKLVFHVVRRIVAEQQDVEDICQEVFIKVHRHLAGFAFESKLSTWIARIAYLTAINYLKKYQRLDPIDPQWLPEIDTSWQNDPEQVLIQQDRAAYLNRLIEELPMAYRTVLTLYHLEEFSCQEIEQITGMPAGTIKNYLFRARKLPKPKLIQYLNHER